MLKYLLPLAFIPGLSFAQPAAAQQPYWWQAANPDAPGGSYYDDQSVDTDGPYGPDPYAARADRFNEEQYRAYRREMWRRYHGSPPPRDYGTNNDDQGPVPYAAPIYPVQPKANVTQTKPVVKKKPAAPKPAAATASTATAPASTAPASTTSAPAAPATATASANPAPATAAAPATASTATATASAAPAATKPAKGGPVSCDKGASIVSSFGFDKVTNKTCEGASLVYSAERGGKPFEIEVNPKSGELTAVKKL